MVLAVLNGSMLLSTAFVRLWAFVIPFLPRSCIAALSVVFVNYSSSSTEVLVNVCEAFALAFRYLRMARTTFFRQWQVSLGHLKWFYSKFTIELAT